MFIILCANIEKKKRRARKIEKNIVCLNYLLFFSHNL